MKRDFCKRYRYVLLLLSGVALANEPASLILHYNCDEVDGGVLADRSGNGLNADCSNVEIVKGAVGNAVSSQGEGEISVKDSALNLTADFSLSLWIKVREIGDGFPNIFKKWNQEVRQYGAFITRGGGTPAWSASYKDSDKPVDNFFLPRKIVNRNWHHLAFVHAASERKLRGYVDGRMVKEFDLPGDTLRSNSAPLRFMDDLIGDLDEIKLYRGLLSDEEILQQVEVFKPVKPVVDSTAAAPTLPAHIPVTGWSTIAYTEPLPADMLVDDFDAAQQEALARINACAAKVAELEASGVWVGAEKLSLSIARKFVSYAQSDMERVKENAKMYLAWGNKEFTRDDALAYANRIPRQEMREVLNVIDEVEAALSNPVALKSRPVPPVKSLDVYEVQVLKNYLTQNGQIIFPHGFNNVKNHSEINQLTEWGVGQGDITVRLRDIFPSSLEEIDVEAVSLIASTVQLCLDKGTIPNVTFSYTLPQWIEKEYPEVVQAGGHFMPLDIDHPKTREIVGRMVDAVMPVLPKDVPVLVKIGNEISFPLPVQTSLSDDFHINKPSVSKYGWTKYAGYLKAEYGTLAALNARWGTAFDSFQAASQAPVIFEQHAAFYDACRFNELRVLDFYTEVRDRIKQAVPNALTYINNSNGKQLQGSMNAATQLKGDVRMISDYICGVWVEGLNRMTDLAAFDTSCMRLPPLKVMHPEFYAENYAFGWLGLAMTYDFQRSLSDGKVMFENELHNLQNIVNRDDRIPPEHMRCVQWMQFVQGLGMNKIWLWSRDGEGLDRNYIRAAYCSMSQSPQLVNTYLRTGLELESVAPQLTGLAQAPQRIALLFSEASAIQDVRYLDIQMATYEALCFLGQGIDFVTEEQIAGGGLSKYDLVVAAGCRNVKTVTLAAVDQFLTTGGKLWRIGPKTLDLDPWGKKQSETFVGGTEMPAGTVAELHERLRTQLAADGLLPNLTVKKRGSENSQGLFYRSAVIDGKMVLFVAQIGSAPQAVTVSASGRPLDQAFNFVTGQPESLENVMLKPWETRFWRVD